MKTMRLLYIFLLTLVIPVKTYAYKLDVDSIPLDLRESAIAVVRSDQMVFTVESSVKARASYRRVITLMNENASGLRIYEIYYDKSRSVQNVKAAVYDANGKFIESVPQSRMMDVSEGEGFISDARVKRILFPVNRYPFTIEVSYDININSLLNLPGWNFHLNPALSVEESSVQFVIPRTIPFRHKEYNMHSAGDSVSLGDNNIYTWSERDIPAIKKWYFSPLSFGRRPVLLAAIDDFEFGGIKGSMRSWQSFGLWAAELNSGLDQLSDQEKKHVADLTARLTNDREKARVLFAYMQSHTRYASIQLGIGGWKPAPAMEVGEKGFGDCKGLTNYMYALLKEAGITSYYTLVKSGENRNIIPSFVSNQFDHIILCVPLKSDTVWLECTNQTIPFNYLGRFTSDRYVLLITPEGGKLARTPSFKNSLMATNGIVELGRREPSRASLTMTATGSSYDDNRIFERKDASEIKRIINSELELGTFRTDTVSYEEMRQGDPVSILSYTLTMSDFTITAGAKVHFRPCMHPFEYQPFDTISVRIFEMPGEVDSILYRLPAGYKLEYVPEKISKEGPYGVYSYEISIVNENLLLFTRQLKINRGIYEGDRARELFAFLNMAAKNDNRRLYLSR
jgi:transglutaminase-like putative cysteine protease